MFYPSIDKSVQTTRRTFKLIDAMVWFGLVGVFFFFNNFCNHLKRAYIHQRESICACRCGGFTFHNTWYKPFSMRWLCVCVFMCFSSFVGSFSIDTLSAFTISPTYTQRQRETTKVYLRLYQSLLCISSSLLTQAPCTTLRHPIFKKKKKIQARLLFLILFAWNSIDLH